MKEDRCEYPPPPFLEELWMPRQHSFPLLLVNYRIPILTTTSSLIPSLFTSPLLSSPLLSSPLLSSPLWSSHSCPAPLFTLIKADSVSLYIFICSASPPPRSLCLHSGWRINNDQITAVTMIKDSCSIHQMSTCIIYFINLFSNFTPRLCILGFIMCFDMPIPKKNMECSVAFRWAQRRMHLFCFCVFWIVAACYFCEGKSTILQVAICSLCSTETKCVLPVWAPVPVFYSDTPFEFKWDIVHIKIQPPSKKNKINKKIKDGWPTAPWAQRELQICLIRINAEWQ